MTHPKWLQMENRSVTEQMNTHEQVEHNLTLHPPKSALMIQDMEQIRAFAKTLGHEILNRCPESRERSLAQTKLEECVMWAIASLARYQNG